MSLPPFDHTDQLRELDSLVKSRRLLALVGAGASIPSGYPSWPMLLDRMEKRLARTSPLAHKLPGVLRELGDPAWQAEELVVRLKEAGFYRFIRETFREPRPPNAVAEPYHLIARLGFRHILTTNYDPCIEVAMQRAGRRYKTIHWSSSRQVQNFFQGLSNTSATPCVVYLHGHYTKPKDVILTETAYAKAYLSDTFQRRLLALFMTQPVLFIGFSMNDPDLGQLMRIVRATFRTDRAQHFGIFGYRTADERDLIARRMQGKYGLRAVFYRIIDGSDTDDHTSLLDLLEYLGRPVGPPGVNKPRRRPAAAETVEIDRGRDIKRSGEKLLTVTTTRTASSVANESLDPHKGKFGGKAEAKGRRVRVTEVREAKKKTYMAFTLVVEALPGAPPLKGPVRFQLHPTFDENDYEEKVVRGKARSRITASYGAFTVGVTIVPERTRLELDLSELDDFPPWFRER